MSDISPTIAANHFQPMTRELSAERITEDRDVVGDAHTECWWAGDIGGGG